MKNIVILFSFVLFNLHVESLENVYDPDKWINIKEIHVAKHSPVQEYRVIWMNTYSQALYPCSKNYPPKGDWSEEDNWMERYGWMGKSYPDNEWITISVADRVPETAKSIFLTGIMILTVGTVKEDPHMKIYFRGVGEEKDYRDIFRTNVVHAAGGVRSPMSVWVPLNENREFQFKWTRSTDGKYPEHTAYGICLYLNAWGE